MCGKELVAADITMVFVLEAAQRKVGMNTKAYLEMIAYLNRLHERPAYNAAVQRIVELTGGYQSPA